jgi:sugar lactone lactonase YvrE
MLMRSVVLCAALGGRALGAQTSAALNAQAMQAYRAKDYARFLTLEQQAVGRDPANVRLWYNAACGEALQGNASEAVRLLDTLVVRKLDLGAEADADFTRIHATPEWAGYLVRLAALRAPVVHSTVAFTLNEPELVATGIAVDRRSGDTFIASVRERKIVRRTKRGVVSDFIQPAQDGFMGGGSLGLDSTRELLYATTSAVPFMVAYDAADSGRSGIYAFDLASGRLARKALLPADGKRHFLNALVVDHQGTVYISDSRASGIYRLRRGADTLELFVPTDVFRAAQGLALSRDERTLYVLDYSDGLWALDLASRTRRKIEGPSDVWLAGLDGLSPVSDGFIAVQIGVQPARVLRLRLDPARRRIAAVDVLEMSHPDYAEPIQGVVTEGAFLYVANSQLGLANAETGGFAVERARPTVVLRLPL